MNTRRKMLCTLTCGTVLVTACLAGCELEEDPAVGAAIQGITFGALNNGDPAVVMIDIAGGTCTGTVIAPRIVLTAKHCAVEPNGTLIPDLNRPVIPAERYRIFWNQTPNVASDPHTRVHGLAVSSEADIALLRLATPAKVAPMPVNDQNAQQFVGAPVRVAGYGNVSLQTGGIGTKRVGMTQLAYNGRAPTFDSWGEMMFTGLDSRSLICNGDSGGPAFLRVGGVEAVAGINSLGASLACGLGIPVSYFGTSINTQVRTDFYFNWITTNAAALVPGTRIATPTSPAGDPPPSDSKPGPGAGSGSANFPLDPTRIETGCSAAATSCSLWATLALLLFAVIRRRPQAMG